MLGGISSNKDKGTSNISPAISLKLKFKVRPRGCMEENSTADKDKDRDTDRVKVRFKGMGIAEGMIKVKVKVKVKRGMSIRRGIIRREVGLVIWIWERRDRGKVKGLPIVSRARFT
jgi:hypothetical protein